MSFDVAAEAYDRFMGRYSAPLADQFVDAAGVPAFGRALDVGCGPGALLRVLADRLGEENVAGVDPSASFVEAARDRHPAADIREASAESLPFDDAAFDATLAQLVVHFMRDPEAGLREMRRVTRHDGAVAVCVWDFAGGRAPQSTFFGALKAVVPRVDDGSRRPGGAPGDLADLMRSAGFDRVDESEATVRVRFASFADWWSPYTLGVSPAGAQLAVLTEGDRARVRELCRSALPDGGFTVAATAWIARAFV